MLFAWVKDKIKAQQEVINSINTSNNEIAIIIENLLFYTTSCFETPTKGVQKNEPRDWKLDLCVDEHTELEIFAEPNPPKRVSRPEACGLRHLAFCVESVEQTVKELAEVGIECEPIRVDDFTGKKMTFFHDPDGLPLELHE